jgi:hypothetical protein
MFCGLARNWYVATGDLEPVYWLMIIMSVANATTNISIMIDEPKYWGLWSYNVLVVWSLFMAVKGLLRLRIEREDQVEDVV